ELHAKAESENRHLLFQRLLVERIDDSGSIEGLHAGVEGADPRKYQLPRLSYARRRRRHLRARSNLLQHVLYRPDVSDSVVDDGDRLAHLTPDLGLPTIAVR